MQLMLNEFMLMLDGGTVSNSAYTQARGHLRHTAFIELNQKAVVEVMYGDENYARFKGFRLLGIDGSKIILPESVDVFEQFGQIAYKNKKVKGKRAYGMGSVWYDLLNRVALDSVLEKARAYEVDLAMGHLRHTQAKDLIVADREYASYRFLATLVHQERDFVIRCSAGSFGIVQRMLQGEGAAVR